MTASVADYIDCYQYSATFDLVNVRLNKTLCGMRPMYRKLENKYIFPP